MNMTIQEKNDDASMEKEFRIKGLMMDPASNSHYCSSART